MLGLLAKPPARKRPKQSPLEYRNAAQLLTKFELLKTFVRFGTQLAHEKLGPERPNGD